jgi:hypothetical protein
MNVLILYAHPEPRSLNGALKNLDGFIQYDKYDFENANVISGVSVEGIIGVKGVGEALKKHLLEVYKESTFESDLAKTNRERLLTLWSKSYPSAPSAAALRSEVPALSTKFGDNFDFELQAYPSKDGGFIHLKVKPKGGGRVTVVNPEAFNQMVLNDPKLRPDSAKKEDEAKKKEEAKKEDEAKKKEEAKKTEDAKKKDDDKKGKGKGR